MTKKTKGFTLDKAELLALLPGDVLECAPRYGDVSSQRRNMTRTAGGNGNEDFRSETGHGTRWLSAENVSRMPLLRVMRGELQIYPKD